MKLSAIAMAVDGRLAGEDCEIERVSSMADADDRALVYALTPELLAEAQASAAGGVIVVPGEFAKAAKSEKPLLVHRQPKLAFARAARLLAQSLPWEGFHTTAIIAASARLGDRLSIGAYAVVGEGAVIGEGTRIGAHSVIAAGVRIGGDCVIHPQVTIYGGTTVGERVIIHSGTVLGSDGFGYVRDEETGRYEQFPQLGQLIIEDEVEIGANTTIDRGALEATVIGRGVKIDNLVHIAHNVTVGEDVVIAAQTGVSGSSAIERGAVIAGQVGIADHVRIEEGAILGAQCGVPSGKVVRGKGVVFWGTPARPIKEYLRMLAELGRLAKQRDKGWRS